MENVILEVNIDDRYKFCLYLKKKITCALIFKLITVELNDLNNILISKLMNIYVFDSIFIMDSTLLISHRHHHYHQIATQ